MNPLAIAKSMINKDFTREWRCITQFQIVKERSLSGAMLPGAIASEQQSVCYEPSLAGGVKVLLSCWTGPARRNLDGRSSRVQRGAIAGAARQLRVLGIGVVKK